MKNSQNNAGVDAAVIRVLIEGHCPKLSVGSKGSLSYQCGINQDGVYVVRVSANDASGAFSDEWIALPEVMSVLSSLTVPFRSTVFKGLFTRKSANNTAFFTAVLRQLGLVVTVDGFPSYFRRGSDMALVHQLKSLVDKG